MSFNTNAAEQHRTTLSLGPQFGHAELKAAYRAFLKWHPDKFLTRSPEWECANRKMAEINVAYNFLSELLDSNGGSYRSPAPNGQTRTSETCSWADLQPKHRYEGKPYGCGFPEREVAEIFVRSSHIVSTGYHRPTKSLYIKFTGDLIYRYFDVPEVVFGAFLNAESHGRFAHRHIYHSFRYERCKI